MQKQSKLLFWPVRVDWPVGLKETGAETKCVSERGLIQVFSSFFKVLLGFFFCI